MALKAIKIDKENVDMLANRFNVEDVEDILPLGFWMVVEFGNEETFDVLTQDNFELLFTVGKEIKNGFHVIEAR